MNLEQLRALLAKLTRDADAKRSEVKDGMPAADVTRIEGEHAALVTEMHRVRGDIAKAEKAESDAAEAARAQAPAQPAQDPEALQRAAQEAVRADRARASTIQALGKRFGREDAGRGACRQRLDGRRLPQRRDG